MRALFLLSLAVLSVASRAAADDDDDLDLRLQRLGQSLSDDGTAARLAELTRSEGGRKALREKIEFLVSWQLARYEKDPEGAYEDFLFVRGADGTLRVREGREPVVSLLTHDVARAELALRDFDRRADELARRIRDGGPLEARARSFWKDPAFRAALFQRFAPEARETDPDEQFETLFLRSLRTGANGKRRVAEAARAPMMEQLKTWYAEMDALRPYEDSFEKLVGTIRDEVAREAAGSDTALLFVGARLERYAKAGAKDPLGQLLQEYLGKADERGPVLRIDLTRLLAEVARFKEVVWKITAQFEKTARELDDADALEIDLAELLRGERSRLFLVELMLAAAREQRAKGDAFFNALVADGFQEGDNQLAVKPGRYADANGQETVEVLEGEYQAILAAHAAAHGAFAAIAERCVEPSLVDLFETRSATFMLQAHVQSVVQRLSEAARKEGLQAFTRAYLVKKGDRYGVRPERARKVEELSRRALEIEKALEKDGRQEVQKE